jgi:Apea-like HEPN
MGRGVVLSKTYAHLMAPFLMAFKSAPPGKHHPAPWKAASGGFFFDVTAELIIPSNLKPKYESMIEVARTIVFLLRLWTNPAITLTVFSSHPFSTLADTADNEAQLLPLEVQQRHFPLGVGDRLQSKKSVQWVKDHWESTLDLITAHSEFRLAMYAIDLGQFIPDTALTMVSLWGALEGLFSPSTSELKFRVSSLIASYLTNPGSERLSLQKEVAKLYDKRSSAAHGKPKHEQNDLLKTFELLRQVLIKIISERRMPTKDHLERLLFGDDSVVFN